MKFFIVFLFFYVCVMAQTPVVSFDPISVSTIAPRTAFNGPKVGTVDPAGNIYTTLLNYPATYNSIGSMSPSGTSTVVAGTGVAGYVDGPALSAQFSGIEGLALDAAGNMYVSDGNNFCIRKITPGGVVSTLAGNGTAGNQDGTGGTARFSYVRGITVDLAGNVFVADAGNLSIRKITPAGVVTTLVNKSSPGAQFTDLRDLTIDPAGNLYVLQVYGQLQKITPGGVVTTVNPGLAYFKRGLVADKVGNLYFSYIDGGDTVRIYKLFPGGNAAILAGSVNGYKDTIGVYAQFSLIEGLSIDNQGNIYLSDNGSVRKLSKPALSFATNTGAASPARYFAISGNYLSGPASLQAPPGYELSLNEAGPWSPTLPVGSVAGEVKVINVFIRLTASIPAGVYNDSVVLSANGAVTKKLGVSGTVTNAPKKLVIIGSGTSACIGLDAALTCYTGRLSSAYNKTAPSDTTINNSLARGSTNCYNGMPSSYVSPYSAASGYTPIKEINITAALALNPDAVLVNYPTNGYDVLSINEIMFCLRTIRDSANKKGVPCYITTTQPRTSPAPFNTAAMKLKLAILKDSIRAAFGYYAIDFWTGLINPADSSILYDPGDHTNMNAAGHNILYQRVLAKNVFATPPATGNGTGLQGVYYNGITLSGAPLLTRIDPTINFKFDWEQQPIILSPAPGIVPEDFYSVRWTGFVQPLFSELYTFYTNSDDGIRVWINNSLLIDSWIDQNGSITRSGTYLFSNTEKYEIKIEFYEKSSASLTKLYWSSASTPKAIIPQSQLFPPAANTPGTGLRGDYYTGTGPLSGPIVLTRIDPTINMLLTYSTVLSPAPGIIQPDNFSIRWTGQVKANYTETYTFYTLADDGIRLWVNGVQLVDNWTLQGPTEKSGTINLVAGQKYDIKIEYFEWSGESTAKLSWSSASTPKAIVPQSQLYPPASNTRMMDNMAALKITQINSFEFAKSYASISPNPVKRGQPARLQINSNKASSAVVTVTGSTGERISNQRINLAKGINNAYVSTNTLAQGLYLINIAGVGKPLTVKLVVD